MREIFVKIFNNAWEVPEITLFSIWHIMYIALIVGLTIGAAFILKNKSQETKTKVLNILAIAAIASYILDFFIMPIARVKGNPELVGDIDLDKLPFHICTLIGCLIPFAQFNTKLKNSKVKDVVVCLAIVASLMYITYPGSALGGVGAFCYKVVQTFLFHGLVFAWGVLSLTTKSAELKFKTIWKQAVGIAIIIVWAALGNSIYSNDAKSFDWFFITGSTFPFIPKPLMPLVVLVAVFGMCAIIYSIDLIVKKVIAKKSNKKEIINEENK